MPFPFIAAAILGSAAIGAGASIAGASSASAANDRNAAQIERNRAENAALVDTNKQENRDLLTGARDQIASGLDEAQLRSQGLIDAVATQGAQRIIDTSTANQGTLDNLTRAQTELNTGLRDQNAGFAREGFAANERTITDYGDRAAAAYQPFLDNGTNASNAINALLGIGGDATAQADAFQRWADSTGFQFTLDSGSRAVNTAAGAAGTMNSGATLKALQDRGQQTAQTYFGSYLSALQGQASQGLSAAGGQAGVFRGVSQDLTANRNNLTSGLVGINDTFGARQGSNLNAYLSGTLDNRNQTTSNLYTNDNAYASNSLGNIGKYTGAKAENINAYASGLAGLNTSSTNAQVAGNNAAAAGQVGVNNDRAANSNNLYGNLGDIATNAAGQLVTTNYYNRLFPQPSGGPSGMTTTPTALTNPYAGLTAVQPANLPTNMYLARL